MKGKDIAHDYKPNTNPVGDMMKKKINVLKTESDKRRKLQRINSGITKSQEELLAGDVVQKLYKESNRKAKEKS